MERATSFQGLLDIGAKAIHTSYACRSEPGGARSPSRHRPVLPKGRHGRPMPVRRRQVPNSIRLPSPDPRKTGQTASPPRDRYPSLIEPCLAGDRAPDSAESCTFLAGKKKFPNEVESEFLRVRSHFQHAYGIDLFRQASHDLRIGFGLSRVQRSPDPGPLQMILLRCG